MRAEECTRTVAEQRLNVINNVNQRDTNETTPKNAETGTNKTTPNEVEERKESNKMTRDHAQRAGTLTKQSMEGKQRDTTPNNVKQTE